MAVISSESRGEAGCNAWPGPPWRWLLALLLGFAVSLLWLRLGGAWQADLGGDPDEAAHAVTSLMLRDYWFHGWGHSPMEFAKAFASDFPRVAMGHYPPFYYLSMAPALSLVDSPQAFWWMQALWMTGMAALTVLFARELGLPVAMSLTLGALMLLMPPTLKWSSLVMADLLLCVLLWLSLWLWVGFLRRTTAGRALGWGCCAAAAILTKGSALSLVLLPVGSVLLLRRWSLWRNWRWWLCALPVLCLAMPWMWWSRGMSDEGMTGLSPTAFLQQALVYYPGTALRSWGAWLCLLALLGLGRVVVRALRGGSNEPAATLLAALGGMLLVLGLVPVGLTARYLLPLQLPLLLFAALGAGMLSQLLRQSLSQHAPQLALVLLMLGWGMIASLPRKQVSGFVRAVEVAQTLDPARPNHRRCWLVSSDPRGEGAVIAAAAFGSNRRQDHGLQVLRGSKVLSRSDWMGRDYHSAVDDAGALLKLLHQLGVELVFCDQSQPLSWKRPHDVLLLEAMKKGGWILRQQLPILRRPEEAAGQLSLYENPQFRRQEVVR